MLVLENAKHQAVSSGAMGRMPATVVIDVQNVYGLGGDVLGIRSKPTPDGVAAALAPYGFDVETVDVPIGIPDVTDCPRVLKGLNQAADTVSDVQIHLATVHAAPALWRHYARLRRACPRPYRIVQPYT